ncbi:MAG: xylulokinase, partial [Clostridiales bacterium]|nr:xylulokinase [Clostridiales bacterium]
AGGSVEHTGELYKAAFAGLDKLPSNNLVFLPYLMGERSPVNDPAAKGVFYGLNLGHDRKTITKAVVEGICLSLKDCLKTANACGIHPEYARVIGGGAKSKEWLQILANVLNLELRTINTTEGGGLGAIILAMTACGRFSSIEEACGRLIEERDIFLPDSTRAEEYEQKYKVYKKLYLRLKGVADQ